MSVMPRRLQRLGASSIVVTLPHEWVKAHGLKAGDTVYIVNEGDRLKIVPALSEEKKGAYIFRPPRVPVPELLSMTLTCLYVNNYNDVIVNLKDMGLEALMALKDEASRLLGVEVVSIDKDKAAVRVVLDDSKLDPRHAIKGLGMTVANMAGLLRRVAEGDTVSDQEVRLALDDLHRYQHLIMRHLVGNTTDIVGHEGLLTHSMMLGTALLGVVGNTLISTIELSRRSGLRSAQVAQVATALTDLLPLVSALVAQPSLKRLHEITMNLAALLSSTSTAIMTAKDPVDAAVLSKLEEVLRTLQIAFMSILCSAVIGEGLVSPEENVSEA